VTAVLMAELSWPEYARALADDPVIFVPCGALEQHGHVFRTTVDLREGLERTYRKVAAHV